MAVTLNQLGNTYIKYVQTEIDNLKKDIEQKRFALSQLEIHMQDVLNSKNSQQITAATGPIIKPNNNFRTETIELPNPFEQLGIQ